MDRELKEHKKHAVSYEIYILVSANNTSKWEVCCRLTVCVGQKNIMKNECLE